MSDTEVPDHMDDVKEVPLIDEPSSSSATNSAEPPAAASEPAPTEAKPDVFGSASADDDDDLFGKKAPEVAAPPPAAPPPPVVPPATAAPEPTKPKTDPPAASAPVSTPPPASSTASSPTSTSAPAAATGATSSSSAAAPAPKSPTEAKPAKPQQLSPEELAIIKATLDITVSKPTRIGDGMSAYIVYQVKTKTNMPGWSQTEVEVQRRFSDFHSLYCHLADTYIGVIVPPCPPKDALGTSIVKLKGTGEEITPFVERRGFALERFMRRVASHPMLRKDEQLKLFLTSEAKMPKPKSNTLALIASKLAGYQESDEWYFAKTNEIDSLENQLKKLHTALENMVKRRKELAAQTTFFAESFGALADAEEMESLKKAMHQMADVEVKVARLHSKQEHRDFYNVSEIAFDYLQMIQATKLCFQQRINAFRAWQTAESTLVKKKENEASLTAKGKSDKLEQAAKEVAEAEQQVTTTHEQFDQISARLKKELKRFDVIRAHDFTHSMVDYVESMMTLEHHVVKAWEAFLPEAKNIGQ